MTSCASVAILPSYWIAVLLLWPVIITGLISNIVFMIALIRSQYFPIEVRLLLANFSATGISVLITNIISSYGQALAVIIRNAYRPINTLTCDVVRTLAVFFVVSQVFTTVSVGIERLITTLKLLWYDRNRPRYRPPNRQRNGPNRATTAQRQQNPAIEYEQWVSPKSRYALAAVLLLLPWAVGAVCAPHPSLWKERSWNLSNNTNNSICYCKLAKVRYGPRPIYADPKFYISFSVLMVAALYSFVWRINQTKLQEFSFNSARYSLQARFQLRQTIAVTSMMIPVIVLEFISFLSGALIIIVLPRLSPGIFNGDHNAAESALNLFVPLPSAVKITCGPLIIFYKCTQLRKAFPSCSVQQNEAAANTVTQTGRDRPHNKYVLTAPMLNLVVPDSVTGAMTNKDDHSLTIPKNTEIGASPIKSSSGSRAKDSHQLRTEVVNSDSSSPNKSRPTTLNINDLISKYDTTFF